MHNCLLEIKGGVQVSRGVFFKDSCIPVVNIQDFLQGLDYHSVDYHSVDYHSV